jgi:hypothetical protein
MGYVCGSFGSELHCDGSLERSDTIQRPRLPIMGTGAASRCHVSIVVYPWSRKPSQLSPEEVEKQLVVFVKEVFA